jgi:hypothetical protein
MHDAFMFILVTLRELKLQLSEILGLHTFNTESPRLLRRYAVQGN